MPPDHQVSVPAQGVGSHRTFGQQLDHVTFGFAIVGSSPTPGLRFTITGLSLNNPLPATPSVVLFQPRQSLNDDNNNWPDEFAVQVIATAQDHILGRVLRLDSHSGQPGWGQDLRLDFLIIEL
jgi:hypothetical protein